MNIREVNERPEGFEEASVIMTGLDVESVSNALKILEDQPRDKDRLLKIVSDYSPNNVSDKVTILIILSYTSFINRKVWHKEV